MYAEYFLNTDPGFGNATQITVSPAPDITNISFTTSIQPLQNGFHHLYVRVKDSNGKWSLTNVKPFYKETVYTSLPNLVQAEYFINTDPGFGNGTAIAISPSQNLTNVSFAVDLSALNNGFHHLYVRVKDSSGKWSLTNVKPFYKEKVYTALPDLVQAEYFLNTDPGFGNGTAITISPSQNLTNVSFAVDLSTLNNGFHHFYLRVKDSNGKWSLTNVKPFYKETVQTTLPNIVKAEYYVNSDPGFGNGINIPITTAGDTVNLQFTADASGLPLGTHKLFVRVKDQYGKWSLTNIKDFDVDCALLDVDFYADPGCSGKPILFSDSSNNVFPLAQYYWNFGDGTSTVIANKGDIQHTFSSGGTYNVKLKIFNSSECVDSIIKTVTVFSTPGTPGTPSGLTSVCASSVSTVYTTTGATHALDYYWELNPVNAGTIGSTGTTATVFWDAGFSGAAQIRVRGVNSICEGNFSSWRNITVYSDSEGGTLSALNNEICTGESTGLLTLVGYMGNIIRWEKQVNSEGWTSITNTTSSYSEIIQTAGLWQYRAVIKNGTCSESYSNVISITAHQSYNFIQNKSICEGYYYTWRGSDYYIPGTYTESYQSIHGCDSIYELNLSYYPPFKTVNLQILLQGLYSATQPGTMNAARSETDPQFSSTIADEITIELHDGSDYSNIILSLDTLLPTTGNISFILPCEFDNYCYITVKHRNSIETVSATPVLFEGGGPINYSFKSSASQAYGNNLMLMTGGYYAIYGGDANCDGMVDGSDMSLIDNAASQFIGGYIVLDINGDGIVDGSDMALIDNNSTSFVQKQTP